MCGIPYLPLTDAVCDKVLGVDEKQEVKVSRAKTHFCLDEVVFAPSCGSML